MVTLGQKWVWVFVCVVFQCLSGWDKPTKMVALEWVLVHDSIFLELSNLFISHFIFTGSTECQSKRKAGRRSCDVRPRHPRICLRKEKKRNNTVTFPKKDPRP